MELTPEQKSDIRQGYLLFTAFGMALGLGIMFAIFTLKAIPELEAYYADTCPENMYCYEPYGAPVEAEYVLQGAIVKVNFLPEGHQLLEGAEANATWVVDWDANASWCVINTQFPQQVLGDPRMDALGHELLHCLIGNFHP